MNSNKRIAPWAGIAAFVFVLLILIPAPSWAKYYDHKVVQTEQGKVRGYVAGEALVWKGVPYAKPPVDELRWKAPEGPEHWPGVRDATLPAKKCTQLLTTNEWLRPGGVDPDSSEDCLYVDIYRPRHPARLPVPVYVWIHGGSNNFGSARDYDGTVLATRSDVVVVVVQYRLGPMGGFTTRQFRPVVWTCFLTRGILEPSITFRP